MAYSVDLRKRVIAALHSGMKKVDACELYDVCKQTLYNWLRIAEERGNLEPKTGFQKGHSHGIKDLESFKAYVDLHPDYTQEEIAEYFSVGSSTVSRMLKKIGYSRKKRVKPIRKGVKKSDRIILKK